MTAPDTATAVAELDHWLDASSAADPLQELGRLRQFLPPSLLAGGLTAGLLDRLHLRASVVVGATIGRLSSAQLPISARTRDTVRALNDTLETLSALHLRQAQLPLAGDAAAGARAVWRSLWAASRQIHVASLIASLPPPGLWQRLHETYQEGRRRYGDTVCDGTTSSLKALYLGTLARECAHASTFTAAEWVFIDRYVSRIHDLVRWHDETPVDEADRAGLFWVAIDHDVPPMALLRRLPSPSAFIAQFSCAALPAQLDADIARLQNNSRALKTDPLPAPLAIGVLRRLRAVWGAPRKRRFPRRRQSYRARICCGLEDVWTLLKSPDTATVSEWMIVNESPDGYATMHVAGAPGKVQTGDFAALREEGGHDWQLCMVRWAMSENPEHLELGLQVLAPRADAGMLSIVTEPPVVDRQYPAVLLPAVMPLRDKALLVTPPGLLRQRPVKLVLLLEHGRIDIRELRVLALVEQSPSADVFSVEPHADGES